MTRIISAMIVLLSMTFISNAQAGKAADKIKQRKAHNEMSHGEEKLEQEESKEEKARKKERKADAKVAGKLEMMNKGKAGKNVENKKDNPPAPAPKSLPEEIEKSDMEDGSGDADMD